MAQYPDEGAAVDAPRSLSMDDAAAAFDDIYDEAEEGDDEPELTADDEPEADEAEGEEEADDSEEETDEPQAPAIAPPASLNAEEKAAWAQLPPEAQQTLAAIETRRTAEVQSGLEKARNAQRESESAAASRIADAERQHAEQLMAVASAYAPQKPDLRLSETNPAAWIAQNARYEAANAQHQQLVQQVQALHQGAVKEQERIDAENMQRMWAEVKSEIPDPTTQEFRDLAPSLTPVALELGYPAELLGEATPVDIRAIKRAAAWKADADKYKALMARQMTTVRAAKKSAKPGAAQPVGSGQARASNNAFERFKRNPSSRSAAAAVFDEI